MSSDQVTGRPVGRVLTRAARRMRFARVAAGFSRWLALVGVAVLALAALDNLLRLPAALRLVGALAALALASVEAVRRVWRPLRERVSAERAAVAIERELGRDDNLLINACQFEGAVLPVAAHAMLAAPLRAALAAARSLPLARLCRVRVLARWGAAALLVLGGWALYRGLFPERCANALARIVAPLADVPAVGSVALAIEPYADAEVAEGAAFTVRVRVLRHDGQADTAAPTLVWAEGASTVAADAPAGESATLARGDDGAWTTTFPAVRRPFAFRAFCGDGCSRSLRVRVVAAPRLVSATLAIAAPDYLGLPAAEQAGVPAIVSALAGSRATLSAKLDRAVPSLTWRIGEADHAAERDGDAWRIATAIDAGAPFALIAGDSVGTVIARGVIQLAEDAAPAVELDGADSNAVVLPGAELALRLRAHDDHGLRSLALAVRGERADEQQVERAWEYLGPPGPEAVTEHQRLVLDPARFLPGRAYAIEAVARDWRPDGGIGRSRPIVVRIKQPHDIAAVGAAAATITALKEAIARQRQALALADNLVADVAEAAEKGRLPGHRDAIADQQAKAQAAGRAARDDAAKRGDRPLAGALDRLVDGEMQAALDELKRLPDDAAKAPARLTAIRDRQREILAALTALIGDAARVATAAAPAGTAAPDDRLAVRATAEKMKDDLADFVKEQERLLERSRSLADAKPQDLSDDQAALLGELAREEGKQAKYLEERLTDFSRLPKMDFADATVAEEVNEVYQEIATATKGLYQKSIEMAVPHEQSGLELAKTLENNLEKWLMTHPDDTQWKMEEPLADANVPIAELPKELEDIVGDLLDDEEKMQEDVEDFSSAWMDSMDKGAGWDAADGPISNMSAKGVTGNMLPNQNEIGGRSGEGRTGRSHGQMAEATAEGKGGRETPTRLSPGAFESGSVKDSSKKDGGGASGGGKVSGQAAEGLRGPVPPPLAERMARLSGAQAQVRQKGEALALALRSRRMPDGSVESAVAAMQRVEEAARHNDGGAIRARYAEAVDALRSAREDLGDSPASLRRERIDLERSARADQLQSTADAVPAGYEEMIGRYFTALAEQGE